MYYTMTLKLRSVKKSFIVLRINSEKKNLVGTETILGLIMLCCVERKRYFMSQTYIRKRCGHLVKHSNNDSNFRKLRNKVWHLKYSICLICWFFRFALCFRWHCQKFKVTNAELLDDWIFEHKIWLWWHRCRLCANTWHPHSYRHS